MPVIAFRLRAVGDPVLDHRHHPRRRKTLGRLAAPPGAEHCPTRSQGPDRCRVPAPRDQRGAASRSSCGKRHVDAAARCSLRAISPNFRTTSGSRRAAKPSVRATGSPRWRFRRRRAHIGNGCARSVLMVSRIWRVSSATSCTALFCFARSAGFKASRVMKLVTCLSAPIAPAPRGVAFRTAERPALARQGRMHQRADLLGHSTCARPDHSARC